MKVKKFPTTEDCHWVRLLINMLVKIKVNNVFLRVLPSCDCMWSGRIPLCRFPPPPPRLPHEEEGWRKLRAGRHQAFCNSLSQGADQGVLRLNRPTGTIWGGLCLLPIRTGKTNGSLNSWRWFPSMKFELYLLIIHAFCPLPTFNLFFFSTAFFFLFTGMVIKKRACLRRTLS